MSNKKIYSIFIAAIVFMSGCKKDFLDPSPTDRLPETAVWQSAQLMEAFLNDNYNDISEGFYSWKGHGDDNQMMAAVCDEAISTYELYEGRQVLINGDLNPDNVENHRMNRLKWSNNYNYINKANIFLKNVGSSKVLDDATKKRFIAEMKTLRAFRYFTLLRRWGGVPLIGEPFGLGADYSTITRASIEQTISFIKKDLEEAITDLPVTPAVNGRLTKGVAMSLKSRLLLYAASPLYSSSNDLVKWQAAADAAKAIMDAGYYSLEPTLEGLRIIFFNGSVSSREIIFRQQTHPNTGPGGIFGIVEYNFCRAGGSVGAGAYSYYTPTQQMIESYEMANGKLISDPTSGYNSQNPYQNRDPRFYAFIYYHKAPFKNRQMDYSQTGRDKGVGREYQNPTGYNMRKFINENYFNADGTSVLPLASQADRIPWIHIRYAEILLNYAEAINEASGPANAYAPLNLIRARAGMPHLPAGLSQAEMRERIRNERKIELAFEEHRYYDVRRWKIAQITENMIVKGIKITNVGGVDLFETVTATGTDIEPIRKFLPHQYFWPIPRAELFASPALTQTLGY